MVHYGDPLARSGLDTEVDTECSPSFSGSSFWPPSVPRLDGFVRLPRLFATSTAATDAWRDGFNFILLLCTSIGGGAGCLQCVQSLGLRWASVSPALRSWAFYHELVFMAGCLRN